MQSSLHQTLERTCGCVPSQPCGSCSGCNGLCSSHSESPGSRPSDLAYACERACSSASRNHNAPSSPLQTTTWGSVSTIYIFYILQKLVMWGGRAYPLRCPRGRDGLAPSSLWPPPPCCCQLLQRECFPCWENRKDHEIKTVFGSGGCRRLLRKEQRVVQCRRVCCCYCAHFCWLSFESIHDIF